MRMVIFGRIQRQLYAAGVIPDNMWGSVLGRSTQEASFLYDMYLDDEDLEAFMASVDVKGVFPQHAAQGHRGGMAAAGAPVR